MRCTLWTLVCTLLLQVLGASAWAMHQAQAHDTPAPCHGSLAPSTAHVIHGTEDETQAVHQTNNSHHCCAVGLGMGLASAPQPLPQNAPVSRQPLWASLSLPPDLRPPI